MDGSAEADWGSMTGAGAGKLDIVADSVPVVRDGAIVVAKVLDGTNGTPLKGRKSTFSSRMAQKRSFAADACTPELCQSSHKRGTCM